jgi:hypothetical protein
MASAKALYWIVLGVLVVSFGSSNTGRNLACKASTAVDHLVGRSMPYVGAVEMALGRTQAGYGHLQANAVRVQVEQARMQAAQARLQAEMVREQLKQAGMLNDERFLVLNHRVVPDVVVDGPNVRVNGQERVIVCPRTRVHVTMPDIPAPQVNVVQDPI